MTLPLDHALWIARFVLMALHRAHTLRDNRGQPLRVVHRDISPENVLLGYDGRVKLIDFGIAISRMASRDTRVGMVKGKLEYMSPEQATGVGDIDYRTDIYSWGLVLYEMLTGHQVLMGDFNSALDRARSPTIVPPRHRNRLLPAPVDDLLMTALAPNRRERFGSARDMMLACMELLHSIDSRYSGDEVGEYVRAVLPRAYDADMNVLGGGGTQVLSDAAAVSGAVPPVSKDDTQESSAYVRPADPPKSTTAAGRARRPPPPIPKEAMDLARRIEPVNHQREPYMDPHEGEVRAHGLGSSDTIVQGAPDQPPELSDLLRAIEDIYEGREDADRPDPGSGPRDETQIYKRR
jgi:serine/threonine-protein kinase